MTAIWPSVYVAISSDAAATSSTVTAVVSTEVKSAANEEKEAMTAKEAKILEASFMLNPKKVEKMMIDSSGFILGSYRKSNSAKGLFL